MKENLINLSFLASGHIVQDVVVATDDPIAAEELVRMLNCGEAFTTVHEDNDVILSDGSVIGTVRYSDTELEYSDFQVEGGDYEQIGEPSKPFNASQLALAGAVGEFISEDEDMTIDEVLTILNLAGDTCPLGLTIEEGSKDKTGKQLLHEIHMLAGGLKNLMYAAHNAGKTGQGFI